MSGYNLARLDYCDLITLHCKTDLEIMSRFETYMYLFLICIFSVVISFLYDAYRRS